MNAEFYSNYHFIEDFEHKSTHFECALLSCKTRAFSLNSGMRSVIRLLFLTLLTVLPLSAELTAAEKKLASGHPRPSYAEVDDISAMAAALRKQLANQDRYSYSRAWWIWDRLRARYVDGGRKDRNELLILQAVFRALILDWHAKLEAKGEGDLMFIFFTTAPGNKTERQIEGRTLKRDVHGGGYHGGWGGAARMRIYEELSRQKMLTAEEEARFKKIVHQSMGKRFLTFTKGSQSADNHSYGNGGGIAMALKLFPDVPQAKEARAWIDRIWAHLADFGDWTEWNYFPYGPIFLHGLIDIAEAMGWIEIEAELINAVGARVLGFVHGGGVRGGPNCGSPVFTDRKALYADPWNLGNYRVETPGRDGHFWYRLAQHYRSGEYLWAAEQSALGGQPPGKVIVAYQQAFAERFGWFRKRGISPKVPAAKARIGLLSSRVHKIPERLYLQSSNEPGRPFASFFLYPKKDAHLDSLSGQLYEYAAHGAKFLHSSGKYSMLPKGGGTGEESLDVLLVMHKRNPFPQHPDKREGDHDFVRKGSIQLIPELLKAENNEAQDSFGQIGWNNYYGPGSKWIRRTVLTREGILVVADEYTGSETLGDHYHAGPVWHLAAEEDRPVGLHKNWVDAPAFDHAWWQRSDPQRVLLWFHPGPDLRFGQLKQKQSQDVQPNLSTYAYRPITGEKTSHFLSVFIPHAAGVSAQAIANQITSKVGLDGTFSVTAPGVKVFLSNSTWRTER